MKVTIEIDIPEIPTTDEDVRDFLQDTRDICWGAVKRFWDLRLPEGNIKARATET